MREHRAVVAGRRLGMVANEDVKNRDTGLVMNASSVNELKFEEEQKVAFDIFRW